MNRTGDAIARAYSSGTHKELFVSRQTFGLFAEELAMLAKYASKTDLSVLTLGCGAGRETFAMHRMGYHRICGADCTGELIEAARRTAKDMGLTLDFQVAAADKLPYAEESQDVVTMFYNIYGHITPHSSRIASLKEIRRVLRPGGVTLLTATNLEKKLAYVVFFGITNFIHRFHNPRNLEKDDKLIAGERKRMARGETLGARSHWFRPNEIPDDAKEVGLEVLEATTVGAISAGFEAKDAEFHGPDEFAYVLRRPS